jgi:hypothetical protein
MPLDRALRATVRNFSTIFLLVALVTLPLQLIHAYVFRNVIAVSELHPAIETFPQERQVSGVGRRQLREAAVTYAVVNVIEIALLPWVVGATAQVMATDRRQGVPTVLRALQATGSSLAVARLTRLRRGPMLLAATLAVAVGWLLRVIGLIVVEPLPDSAAFAGVGLVEGLCRAVGGAFLVGPLAWMVSKDT